MSKYHLFSTGNGTECIGWCFEAALPLRIDAEGFRWETAARVSQYRLRGDGWEAVEFGRLNADETLAKNRFEESEAERHKAAKAAKDRERAARAANSGRAGGMLPIKVTATDVKTGKTETFWSVREAARVLNVCKTAIAKKARAGEPYGGYVFKLEEWRQEA